MTLLATDKELRFRGRKWYAHRLAYSFAVNGEIEDMGICHRCDTPLCVNPAHLFSGTASDNMLDMVAKGRGNHPKGERHSSAKLTPGDHAVIRAKYKRRVFGTALLGKEFGVTASTISKIVTGKIWRHVASTPIEQYEDQAHTQNHSGA